MLLAGNQKRYIVLNLHHYALIFLRIIKPPGCRIRIQFDNSILVIEQNNYVAKIVNAYIIHDLDWSKNPKRNFKLKNCIVSQI